MKKLLKALLGLVTLAPLLGLALVALWALALLAISGPADQNGVPEKGLLSLSAWVFILLCMSIYCAIGLIVLYVIYAFTTKRLTGGERILWAVLVVFLSIFSMPVFWYCHVWKEPEGEQIDPGPI